MDEEAKNKRKGNLSPRQAVTCSDGRCTGYGRTCGYHREQTRQAVDELSSMIFGRTGLRSNYGA